MPKEMEIYIHQSASVWMIVSAIFVEESVMSLNLLHFRESSRLSEVAKSKDEETEAYVSEIEVIHYCIIRQVLSSIWEIDAKM